MVSYFTARCILTAAFMLSAYTSLLISQCPMFTSSSAMGNESTMCEGDFILISITATDLPPSSRVDFYLGTGNFNPYNGEGTFLGSVNESGGMLPVYSWTIPNNFCETYGEDAWSIIGILNPPPGAGCPEIFTSYFDLPVSCPVVTLSGGGDVCEGNCPESPNEIVFTISGDDVPLIADLLVTVSIFPPFEIDDLEVYNGQQIFICMGGLFPSFDPGTNTLTVPSLAVGLSATVEVVSLTSAAGCPVTMDPNSITLNFIPATSANAGTDQTICSFENVTVSGSIGGSAVTGEWTSDGDGVFQDPNSLNTVYTPGSADIDNGIVTLTLSAMDANGACIPATSSIDITIEPSVYIETGEPLTICNTDIALIMAEINGPDAPGIWETTGDGFFDDPESLSTTYTPGFNDLNSGSVNLYFNPDDPDLCIGANETLLVSFVYAPEVEVPDELELCAGDSIDFEIDIEGEYLDITWSTIGDGVIELTSDTEVNYTPGANDIDEGFTIVSVTVISVYAECGQTTYNIPVYIVECDCPDFETISPAEPLCSSSGIIDLSSLLLTGGSGTWSLSGFPPGSSPAMINGDIFSTDGSDPGEYVVVYTLNSPEPGCPASSEEIITVTPNYVPEAGAGIANCGPAMVFISGMTNPFGAPGILWETLGDGTFINPAGLSTSYIPGSSDSLSSIITIVLHTLDSVCGNNSDTAFIFFPSPPFTEFSDDTITVCNEEDKGSIVNFNSLITAGDISGVWLNTGGAPVDFTDPSNVNFNGLPEGYYSFMYQTNSAVFPCQENNYNIVIEVEECNCPLINTQPLPTGLCNDLDQLALGAFIMAGAPGTWSVISSPPGVNPATVSGSSLLIAGADQGTYDLRFTFDSAPLDGCPDSAEISLFIQDKPLIEVTNLDTICFPTTAYNPLSVQLEGSAIESSWTSSGNGIFTITTILEHLYNVTPEDVLAGEVLLYGSSIDTFGFCSPDMDTIHWTIYAEPEFGFSNTLIQVCSNDHDSSVISLIGNVTGDLSGIFSDESNAMVDLSNPDAVDFYGVAAGDYTFYYTVSSPYAECSGVYSGFTVRVIESCSCDSFMLNNVPEVICIPDVINLDSILISPPPGSWVVTNGQPGDIWPMVTGNLLITNGADHGSYLLVYQLTNPMPGCPTEMIIPVVLEHPPALTNISTLCDQENEMYSVSFVTDATQVTSSYGNVDQVAGLEYRVDSIPLGQDIILNLSSSSMQCNSIDTIISPDCACTLFIEDISDPIFLCPGDTFVLIPFLTGAQGFAFSTWIGQTTVMQPTYPVFEEGNYVWIVVDSAGCEERDSFSVELIDSLVIQYGIVPPSCDGLADGMVIITDLQGGERPYTIYFDDDSPYQSGSLPDTIKNIASGLHQLSITDMNGCERVYMIEVETAFVGNLSLGPDISVMLGDSVLIAPVISDIDIDTVLWSPDVASYTDPFWFTPLQTTLLQLTVMDQMGCLYTDEKLITVSTEKHFYVPTIFSPDGDQINDVFSVYTSSQPVEMKSLEIFDRWGGKIYSFTGGNSFSWDGTIKGKPAASGVYVVRLIYVDEDGNDSVYISDLTLLR